MEKSEGDEKMREKRSLRQGIKKIRRNKGQQDLIRKKEEDIRKKTKRERGSVYVYYIK